MARTWRWSRLETCPSLERGVDAGLPKPCRNKSANKRQDCSQDRSSHKPPSLNASWAGICLLLQRDALHMNSPC